MITDVQPGTAPHVAGVEVLTARGVEKAYEGIHAVRDVSIGFRAGEVRALLGENGAGKSTLIKMLTGAESPDSGEIVLDGGPVSLRTTAQARRLGVVALYQEVAIVPTVSVAENILLGTGRGSRGGVVQPVQLRGQAAEILARLGQTAIDPRAIAGGLSPVKKTMVAIARCLAADARVIFFDEPTAALTDSESEALFAVIRSLRDDGIAIGYVSHRLEEVFEISDTATIMRNGRVVAEDDIANLTIPQVINAMVGREHDQLFPPRVAPAGGTGAEIRDVSGVRVDDVSFDIGRGEIFGVAGLAGSGRSELLRILAGEQSARAGSVRLAGEDTAALPATVGAALRRGISLVPEERRTQGLVTQYSVAQNVVLSSLPSVSTAGFLIPRRIRSLVDTAISRLRIKTRDPRQPVGELSGGNQQKVVLAKQLARNPRLLLLDEPTRGIDVGAKSEIYTIVRALAADGMAVLVVSSELTELLGLCDRIAVLHEGRIAGVVDADSATEDDLLHLCYGRTTDVDD